MKQHMQVMIDLLTKNDFNALLVHYIKSSEADNISQLAYLYLQGQKSLIKFGFYQKIAADFIKAKELPLALIKEFKTNDMLSFFTPALKSEENFTKTNQQQRNVLHYLLVGKNLLVDKLLSTKDRPAVVDSAPSFNYLRSMMLFESNDILSNALCQRDSQNFTPVELYLLTNKNLSPLPTHELSALLALIEIELKQQAVDKANYTIITQRIGDICTNQSQLVDVELQRILLLAAYYNKPIEEIVKDVSEIMHQ